MAAAAAASSACASVSTVYDISEEKTNGTRLARLLIDGGTHVLRKFFHSIYPTTTLQHVLNNNFGRLQSLKSRRVIFDDEWEKLFPSSGDPPDSKTFDITLLHLLLRELCHLTAPPTGWQKMPADSDASPEANVIRIKCFRNELCHSVSTGIPNSEFEDKWNKISLSLQALEASVYQKRIEKLKNDPIDHETRRVVAEQVEHWKRVDQNDESGPISSLCSCLPDKIPEELMFGRAQEIKQAIEIVQSETVPVALITGGPGFGKTTVANEVAHELAKPENERTVLFCSLLTKKTFIGVTTEMIHSCGTIQTQLPENPEQWLKDWSKQIQTQVTFILDNADGVLESGDRSLFLNTLSAVRRLSKQNITFVITARNTFSDSILQSKEVRLNPLSPEEAKYILESRVNDQDVRQKLSKTEKIAELCGGVPLALCIVGSLLSDYTEDKLITHLEEEPLSILEDDQTSVENAIKTSFDLLTKAQQDALILMSVFPGPFNTDAVEAIMGACTIPGTLPVSVLRSLKNRSLVEQTSSHRYQMHPLIHAFAKKIGGAEHHHLLHRGENLGCAHFISRFVENTNMYWTKDNCKQSVEAFNKDSHNFEHFLQVYAQGRKNQDHEIMDACKTFLDDLPQKCMYLEMCVLPKFYILILEKLLEKFNPEMQPVHRVELLCLLGHETRKKGDKRKYENLMEEAEKVHSKNYNKFEKNSLSEVYFRNSYSRFLSEKKDRNENQREQKENKIALKVSKEQLGNHPETAATLLRAGINAKLRKEYVEAKEKLMEALALSKELLGKHLMTAQLLKNIADLHLQLNELDTCLAHYANAIKMFEDLGMGDSKEVILTLKNLANCHTEKGNFDEAITTLTKAEQVAERELEEDHTWKVSIKTNLATLHDKMGSPDEAKAVMREGLLMGNKLNLPIVKMGNKHKIRKFIDRYPETFPEKEFPRM